MVLCEDLHVYLTDNVSCEDVLDVFFPHIFKGPFQVFLCLPVVGGSEKPGQTLCGCHDQRRQDRGRPDRRKFQGVQLQQCKHWRPQAAPVYYKTPV